MKKNDGPQVDQVGVGWVSKLHKKILRKKAWKRKKLLLNN